MVVKINLIEELSVNRDWRKPIKVIKNNTKEINITPIKNNNCPIVDNYKRTLPKKAYSKEEAIKILFNSK